MANVAHCHWERPGGLTPSVVGFTVDPDQWCRHDRGQAWPGSSAPYRHLPHHRPPGGARPECTRGLSRSVPGTSPLPSAPRTLRFTRPGGGRPSWEPPEPNGGRVSHRGETIRSDFSSSICWIASLDLAVEASLKHSALMFVHLAPALSLMLSSPREDGAWYEGLV